MFGLARFINTAGGYFRVSSTDEIEDLREADFHIVTAPTPIDGANRPDN